MGGSGPETGLALGGDPEAAESELRLARLHLRREAAERIGEFGAALELGLQLAAKFGPEDTKEQLEPFDFTQMTPEQGYAFRKFLMTMPGVDRAGFLQVQSEMKQEEEKQKEAARKRRQERRAQSKRGQGGEPQET